MGSLGPDGWQWLIAMTVGAFGAWVALIVVGLALAPFCWLSSYALGRCQYGYSLGRAARIVFGGVGAFALFLAIGGWIWGLGLWQVIVWDYLAGEGGMNLVNGGIAFAIGMLPPALIVRHYRAEEDAAVSGGLSVVILNLQASAWTTWSQPVVFLSLWLFPGLVRSVWPTF